MKIDFGFQHIVYAIAAVCLVVLFWLSPIVAVAVAVGVAVCLRLLWKRIKRDLDQRFPCPRCASVSLKDESPSETYAGPDVIVRRSEIPQIFRCERCAAWFERQYSGAYASITGEDAADLEKYWSAKG